MPIFPSVAGRTRGTHTARGFETFVGALFHLRAETIPEFFGNDARKTDGWPREALGAASGRGEFETG
ncbi:MAG: hypothetical protein ACLFMZ_11765 [Spirochaetaceae bacterium]